MTLQREQTGTHEAKKCFLRFACHLFFSIGAQSRINPVPEGRRLDP
jgi:hypothetical protein